MATYKKEKKGREEEWSWDETPEVKEALRQYHLTVKKSQERLREIDHKHGYDTEGK